MRWATTALCTLAVAALALFGTSGAGASGAATPVQARADGPPLSLLSQTPWVTAQQPWFNIALGVGSSEEAAAGSAGAAGLHVSLTFYGRLDDSSQVQQAISGSPPTSALGRPIDVPVSASGPAGLTASACVTVLPEESAGAPAAGPGACAAGSPTLTMPCTPLTGRCGDVYPVGVALLRQGSSTPLAHFTTFLTYQEPMAVGDGGPLRVALVVPVSGTDTDAVADALAAHRDVVTTLAVSPATVSAIVQAHSHTGDRALDQLDGDSADQVVDQPYVPINLAALSEAGIAGEIGAQVTRGTSCCGPRGSNRRADPGSTPPPRSPRVMPATWPRASRWRGRRSWC